MSPRVGRMMARLDAPYPWRKVRLYEAGVVILALMLVVSIVLVQHRAGDLAFYQYTLTSKDVELPALIAHPGAYQGQRIHVIGVSGDIFVNDIENVFGLSSPSSASSDAQRVLVRTRAYAPASQRVEVWGVYEGVKAIKDGAPSLSLPTIRAEYVRGAG